MIQVRKILQTAIETGVDYTLYISSYALTSGTMRIYSCDTMHINVGRNIILDGTSYTVTAFVLNTYIEVANSPAIDTNVRTATIANLFFFSGKLKDTNVEKAGFRIGGDNKVPFFWSREPFSKVNDAIEDSAIGTTVDLVFYLLDKAISVNGVNPATQATWLTYDHHTNVIEPLENLLENRIIPYFRDNNNIFDFEDTYDVRGHAILSVDDNTNNSLLFDETLSGVEVRLSLPINKEACDC